MTVKERLQERYDYYNHIVRENELTKVKFNEDTIIYCKGKRDAYAEAINYLDNEQTLKEYEKMYLNG